jgi:hypothetical protein
VAEADHFLDVLEELELVLDVVGANIAPFDSLPTSLARSMIFRWPSSSRKPASPVMK